MAASARRARTALFLVVLSTAWAACEGPGAEKPAPQRSAASVTSERGGEITLSGRVTAWFGAHLFAVGSGAERVVVVTTTPVRAAVGSDVDVTGRVRTFRRQELEAELGIDLGPPANELEDETCLVASVARLR